MTPHELAAWAERATPDEQDEVLGALFELLYPQPRGPEPEWQGPGTLREPLFHHWKVREVGFFKMLDCGAFESAAISLVPSDYVWAGGIDDDRQPIAALALPNAKKPLGLSKAQTFTLALAAAVARTMEG